MSDEGTTPPGAPDPDPPPDTGGDPSSVFDAAGQALFRLGRVFGRQPAHRALAEQTGQAVELSRILVVQAVEAGAEAPDQEVTVGAVAARLGVDPSTASRLVAEAIQAGYLVRAASPADARRARLGLTAAGRELAGDARRYQRAVFEQVTRDWPERERAEFARLFVKFAAAVAETLAAPAAPGPPARR